MMSTSRRKKKSLPSLLLEPTVEEEQRIERLAEQQEYNDKKYGSLSCHPQPMTINNAQHDNRRDNNSIQLTKINKGDNNKNNIFQVCKHQLSSGLYKTRQATENVIMSSTSKAKHVNYENNNNSSTRHKQNTKQLTNLLAILFGLLLLIIVCINATNSAATTNTPSIFASINRSSGNDSLFNSRQTSTTPASSSSETTSFSTSETDSITTDGFTTNTIAGGDGGGGGGGGEPEAEGETTINITERPVPFTSTTVAENGASTPMATPTAATAASNYSTTNADREVEEDVEAEDGDEASMSDSEKQTSSGGGKLSSGFIIETAGEAADQLLKKLKPTTTSDDDDGDGASSAEVEAESTAAEVEESTTASESVPLERRDLGNLNSKQTTELPSSTPHQTTTHPELQLAMDTYTKWRSVGDDFIELFSRKMLPVIVEHGYDIDAVTVTGLLQVFNGIRTIKPWALKLLDASAKITPGVLVGTQSDFGDFDECLGIRVDDPSGLAVRDDSPVELDEETGLPTSTLVGRYCLADVEFPKPPRVKLAQRNEELNTDYAPIELRRPLLNFSETASFKDTIFVETGNFFHMLYVDPLRLGVCLTNKIDPDSFAKVVNKLFEEFKVNINFKGRCVTKYDKVTWTIQQKVSAWVIVIACCLVILCTLLDVLHTKLNKFPLPNSCSKGKLRLQSSMQRYRPLFTSFSIIRNTKRLCRPQVPSSSKYLLLEQQKQHQNNNNNNNSSSNKQTKNLGHHRLSQQLGISANCSTSISTTTSTSGLSYSSSESSPSIERRSTSANGSAVHLIHSSESSMIGASSSYSSISSPTPTTKKVKDYGLAHFTTTPSSTTTSDLRQNNEINLLCLHGIRVITMTWMIVNHTYLFGGFFVLWAYRRLIDISEWPKSISFQFVLNGWLTVETYFFLGATIIVLSIMPAMKAHKFTYITYVLHRLIRLLPAYTGLICLNFLWPLISSGPVWLVKGKSFIQTPCENYLWTNYLFINNWIWPEKQVSSIIIIIRLISNQKTFN